MRRKRTISLRKRLFIIMLLLSIIPTILITAIASLTTYRRLYEDTIQYNSQAMQWSQIQLLQFTEEMKNLFYSMEFDSDYKQAVINWYSGIETLQDRRVVRDMLLNHLNLNSFLRSLNLFVQGAGSVLIAERAGVNIEPESSPEAALAFPRSPEMQTNIFFKLADEGLYAVHNIHRFEDRALLAQQTALIKPGTFEGVVSRLRIFDEETIYILNDESEPLLDLQGGSELPEESVKLLRQLAAAEETLLEGGVQFADIEGTICFSTYSPHEKLYILKTVPRGEIVRSVLPTVYTGIIIGLLSLTAAVGFSVILSRIISRPVERLAERVQHIEMQNLVLEKDEETEDEVSILEHHISAFVQRIRDLIRNEYETRLQARMAQVNALQAQINPHFLHNTLQLIGSISLARENPEVYTISSALSSLMRYSMDFEHASVTLEEELDHLDNYFLIQKQRFMERFFVELSIDREVRSCRIPKMLIQPIVENSFTHGFSHKSGRWKLAVTAYEDESGKVQVIIRDNGVGIAPGKVRELNTRMANRYNNGAAEAPAAAPGPGPIEGGHIGLVNVNDRIKLTFSPDDGVVIRSQEGAWTEVQLVFDAKRS